MNKKLTAAALAAAMTASLLAGCSGSAASTTPANTTPASAAAPASQAGSAAATAGYDTGLPELDEILNNADGRLAEILAAGKITCVSEVSFAPYEFVDPDISGEQASYVGSDMELARYIANALGVELEINNVVWEAVATGVQTGKFDMAISALLYTEERAESMDMSDIYMYDDDTRQTFIVPEETVGQYTTLADFNGKHIAYQMGSVQANLVAAQLTDIEASEYSTVQDALLALKSGKCDAVAIASEVGEPMVAANEGVVLSDVDLEYDRNGLCVACQKGEESLVAAINVIIADVLEQDLYTQWIDAAGERVLELGL